MHYFLSWYKVANFAQWQAAFEGNRPSQVAAGLKVEKIWQAAEDPSRIIVLFAIDNQAKTVAFLQSAELGALMQAAGVLEAGGDFLNEIAARPDSLSSASPQ